MLRPALRLLSAIAPPIAARVAERFWFAIRPPRVSEDAQRFLQSGTPFTLQVTGRRVAAWQWGAAGTGPTVLLMHGWGGYAGQLYPFVEPLVRAGYCVIAFDAPSHGASAPGRLGAGRAILFDFSDTLIAASADLPSVAGVIAHSGGCAAAAWALRTHPAWIVERMVFVAPFGSPSRYMDLFQRMLGFSDAVMRRFRERTERRFGFAWSDFDVPRIAEQVKTPPVLVMHDRDDRETSWQDGADIAARWPHATLRTTTGLGHNRILRDADTVDAAVRFIATPPA